MQLTGSDTGNDARNRILVCDDDRHVARLIQVNLERQGYDVTLAYDGEEAIECLRDGEFDRAVVDLMMPRINGYEVLEWIRTHEKTENLWVAMVTGNADGWRGSKEIPYRADLYVEKPFNPSELLKESDRPA